MLVVHLIRDVAKIKKSVTMYKELVETIDKIVSNQNINEERKAIMQPLIDFVQQKVHSGQDINLNFICTHN